MTKKARQLNLVGYGPVVELLPFVFNKIYAPSEIFFDRFALLDQQEQQDSETVLLDEEQWLEAIQLLERHVLTQDMLTGRSPETDPVAFAALIAAAVHRDQQDKLGFPYIEHPRRVFLNSEWSLDPEAVSAEDRLIGYQAAWLHDVLEDSSEHFYRPLSPVDLSNWGFDFDVVATVMKLTKGDAELDRYYSAIEEDSIARAVKLADIADNLSDWRHELLDLETSDRLKQKYQQALRALNFSIHEDNWLELRVSKFHDGPVAAFAYEESKQALRKAELRKQGKTAPEPKLRRDIEKVLDAVNDEVKTILDERFWELEVEFLAKTRLPKPYSLEGLVAALMLLYVKADSGDVQAQESVETLSSLLDALDRSEASFEFRHLGIVPRNINSKDVRLRLTNASALLRKIYVIVERIYAPNTFELEVAEAPMEIIRKLDLEILIDAAFLDFQFNLLPWSGRVFKYLFSEIFERSGNL